MEIKSIDVDQLTELRKQLHQKPELSGEEKNTSLKVIHFIEQYHPDKIITNIGGYGLAAIFNGKAPGKTVMIRSELDALPIQEQNTFQYRSQNDGISHKCGHDGHIVMVAGLAALLALQKPESGRVILLFQPAEETGQGAKAMVEDSKFKALKPDFIFGLHNLPGFPTNQIVIRNGTFASASKGMIIQLEGKTSHAAEPENGISPANAMASLMQLLPTLPSKIPEIKNFSLATLIHARLGDIAFGTSPGYAEVMVTLRAFEQEDMNMLCNEAEKLARQIAEKEHLTCTITYREEFHATTSSNESVELIKKAAEKNNFNWIEKDEPFKWSEDFGWFTQKYKGAFFGLGAGEQHPQLHHPDYDFPDEIISTGVKLFYTLINNILNQ
ncbi:MAG TPA: amidohydrolase [Bacteroidia bacterium]|nr:amidohydrolase [Bacteroidia bacterium]